MAAAEWLRLDPFPVAKAIGVISFCTLCVLGYRQYAHSDEAGAPDRSLWLLGLFACSASLAIHYMGGLETGLYCTLIFVAVTRRLREQETNAMPWSALLFAAVIWSRPEGIVIFLAMAIHDAGFRLTQRRILARELAWYVVPVAAYVGELAISDAYYGDPLPQTFYAKTANVHGLSGRLALFMTNLREELAPGSYLRKGMAGTGITLIAPLAALIAFTSRARVRHKLAFLFVTLAQLALVVLAKRDWAPGFRFGAPALPLMFVLIVEAIAILARRFGRRERAAGWGLFALVMLLILPVNVGTSRNVQAIKYVDAGGLLAEGTYLAALAEPGGTLSSYDIGGQGYAASGFDVLDTKGLTVREMAKCNHGTRSSCSIYVASVRPDLLRIHPRKKDGYVLDTLRELEPYVSLDTGHHFVRRALLLMQETPVWASTQRGEPNAAGLRIVAHDLASELAVGQATSTTVYFQRDAARDPQLRRRRFEWHGSNRFNANASPVLWQAADDPQEWKPDEIFADYALLRAPPVAGRFELWAVPAAGEALLVGAVDVIARRDARSHAASLISAAQRRARSVDELVTIRSLERAVELDSSDSSRNAYQQRVIARAQRLRGEAQRLETTDRDAAFGTLREAKWLLHRAFALSGRATPSLRAEIDTSAAAFAALAARELQHGKSHRSKHGHHPRS